MPSQDDNQILIISAESSSALYAQRFMELSESDNNKAHFFGVGNKGMVDAGFEAIGRSEEMAVVGLVEVLKHYKDIKGVFNKIVSECKKRRPKFALLLDYPDFNLKLAKELKKMGIPVVYFISPQLWAWRKSRINIIRECVSKMLVLFPFEKDFYEKHRVDVEFVGHPLLDELKEEYFSEEYRSNKRAMYGLSKDSLVLGLMPGSRKSEIKYHLETQLKVAKNLEKKGSKIEPVLLLAPGLSKDNIFAEISKDIGLDIRIIQDDPFEMICLTDLILCASGTATLLVGLMHKPMVIMYKMNSLTSFIMRRLVKYSDFFGMINLINKKKVVPELFQEEASVENISLELNKYIDDVDYKNSVISDLKNTSKNLEKGDAIKNVYAAVQEYF